MRDSKYDFLNSMHTISKYIKLDENIVELADHVEKQIEIQGL